MEKKNNYSGGVSVIGNKKNEVEIGRSFYEDLKEMNDTINESRHYVCRSKMSNLDDIHTLKNQRMTKNKRKNKRNPQKIDPSNFGFDKRYKQPKMLDFLKHTNLSGRDSIASDLGALGINKLLGNQFMEKNKGSDSNLDTDSYEEIYEKKKMNHIVYKNNIGKLDQKISVSNYNCSCSIF